VASESLAEEFCDSVTNNILENDCHDMKDAKVG